MTHNDGRDRGGRFAVGNAGGPGRPKRKTEAEYLDAIHAAVSLDDWRRIVLRAVVDAQDGDAKARDWLAKYLVGTPNIRLDVATENTAAGVVLILPDNERDGSAGDDNRDE